MIKIMKLFAMTMVVTLLLLASCLAQARTEPFQFESKPIQFPPEPVSPSPNQDAEVLVEQFPIPIICTPACPPPKL
ncbi:unnamed protein product [Eruca vesicaria subsp. sativa]|uniref:Secreted protein n=1 Tax=Eruca vesicaria subsp. sativa TaxID=29727 RepID=A0ABC8LVX2_ERUVS|nr:unnamed protein product [Eruca vesicaria subsp. sativa]